MTPAETEPQESPPRRTRRKLTKLIALIVVVAVATGAYWWFSGRRERELTALDDPATVELPNPPDDPAPVLAYLSAEGTGLVTAVRTVDWAAVTATEGSCQGAVAALDAVGSPTALRAAAEAAPDAATGDVAQAFIDSAIVFLSECLAGNEPDPDDVRFAAHVWGRQLTQLGA